MRDILPFCALSAAFFLSSCGGHVLMSKNGPDGTKVDIQSVDVVTGKDAAGEYETTKIIWKNTGTCALRQARIDFKSYDAAGKVTCRAKGWPLVSPLVPINPGAIHVTDTGRTYISARGVPRSERAELLSLYGLEAENKNSRLVQSK